VLFRSVEDSHVNSSDSKKQKKDQELHHQTSESQKPKKQKVAMLLAYCGSSYQGMQINPNARTIESELHAAFAKSGVVSPENALDPSKVNFVRSCRTDKGVHAAGQVVSLKALMTNDIVEKINHELPDCIRVFGVLPVMKGFHAKTHCDSRWYEYLLPTYSFMEADPALYTFSNIADPAVHFAPTPGCDGRIETVEVTEATEEEMKIKKAYRVSDDTIKVLKEILECYVGTHNYHNFTIGKKFAEKSSERYIMSFQAGTPFVKDTTEWISLRVHGQSFMLHQIRKMDK